MYDTYVQFLIGYVCSGNWVTSKLLRKIRDLASDYVNQIDSRYRFTVSGLVEYLGILHDNLDDDELDKITCELSGRRYDNMMNLYAERNMIM